MNNCENCRFGWETGGCKKMVYQSPIICWTPMTEAQLFEQIIKRKEHKYHE